MISAKDYGFRIIYYTNYGTKQSWYTFIYLQKSLISGNITSLSIWLKNIEPQGVAVIDLLPSTCKGKHICIFLYIYIQCVLRKIQVKEIVNIMRQVHHGSAFNLIVNVDEALSVRQHTS